MEPTGKIAERPPAPRVFISYRRTDSRHVAGRLRDHLVDALGDPNVFYDVDSIEYGTDFRASIRTRSAVSMPSSPSSGPAST